MSHSSWINQHTSTYNCTVFIIFSNVFVETDVHWGLEHQERCGTRTRSAVKTCPSKLPSNFRVGLYETVQSTLRLYKVLKYRT